jgi:hypothetical protein
MNQLEEQVLSYIAIEGDLDTVRDAGVTADHFLLPANRTIFNDILSFHRDYGEPPTPEVVLKDHPTFKFATDAVAPIGYLVAQLIEKRTRTIIEVGLGQAMSALDDGGPERALQVLRVLQTQAVLANAHITEVDYATTGTDRLEWYRNARENPDAMRGLPTGFVFLDKLLRGIQSTDFFVLTGLAKSCKTTVLLAMLRTAFEAGAKPLALSFEMSYPQIARRLDGFTFGINPNDLLSGQVSEKDWRRLERELTKEVEDKSLIFTEDRAGSMTVSGLDRKIEQLNPDIVFLDGAYFLRDEISGETQTALALTNVSRGLRKISLDRGVPLVVTTQSLPSKVGAKGLTANSLGYTSAWVQDATAVIGMEATDEIGEYVMKIIEAREAPRSQTTLSISFDPPSIEEAPPEDENDYPY